VSRKRSAGRKRSSGPIRLTDKGIRGLKPPLAKTNRTLSDVERGLVLRCTPKGVKSWYFVYYREDDRRRGRREEDRALAHAVDMDADVDRQTRRQQWMHLGKFPDLLTADAREKVRRYRGELVDEIDPVEEREKAREVARSAKTFRELCVKYVDYIRTRGQRTSGRGTGDAFLRVRTRAKRGPKKTWASDARILLGAEATAALINGMGGKKLTKTIRRDRAVPLVDVWGDRSLIKVSSDGTKTPGIEREEIEDWLDKIEGRAPVQANRALSCLKVMFTFAVRRSWMPTNSAADVEPRGEEHERTRVLTDEELRRLWSALDAESETIRDVVKVLNLTGARSAEVFGMEWREILKVNDGWWRVPGRRTKNGRDHAVWIASSFRAILDRRRAANPHGSPYVFVSPKGIGRRAAEPKPAPITTIKNAVARLITATDDDPWVPHDLRRTLKTRLGDLGVPPHVKDRVLNHVSGRSEMDAPYDHYDYAADVRAALERWDRAVLAITKNERITFGSWELDVQKVKDAMHADRGENVVSFRARA
jgi:integrase